MRSGWTGDALRWSAAAAILAMLGGGAAVAGPPPDGSAANDAGAEGGAAEAGPEPETVEELPPTVVTATRREKDAVLVPFTVHRITLSGARSGEARTTGESLRAVPGVSVQKTGPGQSSPYVRGLTGYHTLWLVDGVRLNNSVWRSGPNQYGETIDPLMLGRLELVKGPHSVLYGSDAVGGTIQAFTRPVPRRGQGDDRLPFGGRLLYRYASAEASHIGRVEGWGRAGPIGASAGASIKGFGDTQTATFGTLENTGYKERDADAKVAFDVSDQLQVTGAFQLAQILAAPRTHKTTASVSYQGTKLGNELRRNLDQDRLLGYVQVAAKDLGALESAHLTLSYQRQGELQDRIRSDGRRDRQGVVVHTLGVTLDGSLDTPVGVVTAGVEYYHDEVTSFRRDWKADGSFKGDKIQGPVGDDAHYDLASVFLQDEIELGSMFDAILGLRYTYAQALARQVEDPDTGNRIGLSDDWSALVGSVRFMAHLADAVHPYVGISQGFRAPNLSDLSRLDSARSNELEIPSPGLDPERYWALEAGVKIDLDPVYLQAAWFHLFIKDMIVRRPTGQQVGSDFAVIKENSGDGWITGLEGEAGVRLGSGVTAFCGWFWMDGRVETFPTSAPGKEKQVPDRFQPAEVSVGLRWESGDERFRAEAQLRYVHNQRRMNTRDRADTQRIPPNGTPGYALIDLRGSAQLTDNLRVFGGVENLANRTYRVHGSGQNGLGTNAIFGLELTY